MHKKVLSVLLAASVSMTALTAGAKDGSSPSLKINGVLRAVAVGTTQKIRTDKGVQFNSYGNITFNAGGVANNGLTYGALAVLQLDRSKPVGDKFTEAYVYLGSDAIGSFQFGDTNGVSSLMMYDATDVMGGAGGFDGNLYRQLNLTRGIGLDQNIGHVNNGQNRATKLTWISPEVSGWQVGASYTPNTFQYGRSYNTDGLGSDGKPAAKQTHPYAVNHTEGGVSFTEDIGAYTVGVYLTGALGKAKGPRAANQGADLHSVKAWQFGTLVDYQSWQFGAGYFDNGKSYMRRDTKYTNTRGFNLGVSYGMGPVSLALGYTGTERTVTDGKAKADISSFTVDYSVADGLAVFGEVNYFTFRSPTAHQALAAGTSGRSFVSSVDYLDRQPSTNKDNSGAAFVLGTRINF